MDTTSQHLGQVIRRHRRAAGLSQEELGFRSALHPNYIGMIERGARNITVEALIRIGDAMGVPASQLIAELEAMGDTDRGGEEG